MDQRERVKCCYTRLTDSKRNRSWRMFCFNWFTCVVCQYRLDYPNLKYGMHIAAHNRRRSSKGMLQHSLVCVSRNMYRHGFTRLLSTDDNWQPVCNFRWMTRSRLCSYWCYWLWLWVWVFLLRLRLGLPLPNRFELVALFSLHRFQQQQHQWCVAGANTVYEYVAEKYRSLLGKSLPNSYQVNGQVYAQVTCIQKC